MPETKYIELDVGLGDNIVCAGLLCYLQSIYNLVVRIPEKQMHNKLTYETFFAGTGIELVDAGWMPKMLKSPHEILQRGNAIDNTIKGNLPDPFKRLFSAVIQLKQGSKLPERLPYPLGFFYNYQVPYGIRFKHCPLRDNSFKIIQLPRPNTGKRGYVFVHDDIERGYPIPKERLPKMDIVRVKNRDNNTTVLAYRNIIENAKEIHCIDSSFFHLVNSFKPKGKLVYHWYARPNSPEFDMHPEWEKLK